MSKTIDEKVVQMKFDNRQFEQGVSQTMSTLDKLKQRLHLTGASKGLDDVQKSAKSLNNNMSFDKAEKSLSSLEKRFSTLGVAGMTVIQNLTNTLIGFAKKASDYSIGGIISGGKSRATKIENARFQMKGLLRDFADADKRLNDIMADVNYGVESTAYGLDAAATVAAQLVASGIQAGDGMRKALRGISGVAAMTNSSYEEIGRIYTKIAGNGRLMGEELLQLSSRGMNAAAVLAKSMNKTEAEVRDMVSKGKISFETFSRAMDDAFGEHAKDANKTLNGVLSNIRAALSKIGADFFGPIIAENSPLVLLLNSVRERINDIRKNLSPITKEVTDGINAAITKFDTWFKKGEKYRFGFSPIQKLLKPLEKAQGVLEPITETAGRFSDKIREIEGRINSTLAPINKVSGAIQKVTDSVHDYEKIVDQIIYGTWDNGRPRLEKLTEAGINYYKAQNMVNERLGAQFRYSQDIIDKQDEMLGLNKKTIKSTEKVDMSEEDLLRTMQQLTDEELKQYGLTDDQVSAFRELDKVAKMTGLSMSYLLDVMKNGKFDTRFLIFNSLKNIGLTIVTIFKSIGQAFAEAFQINDTGLFSIIAAFHRFTELVKNFVQSNAHGLTNIFKGVFSILHLIVTIASGAFKAVMHVVNTLLDAFGMNITDALGYIGLMVYNIEKWITADNGLIGVIKVLLDWLAIGIKTIIDWIRNNEKIQKVLNGIKKAFHGIGQGFNDWIAGLRQTDNIPKYIFEGLINGIKEYGPKVWEAIKGVALGLVDTFKNMLGIHSPSKVFFAIGGFIIAGLTAGIMSGTFDLKTAVQGIIKKFIDFFKGINLGNLIAGALVGGGILLTSKALNIANNFVNMLSQIAISVSGVLNGLRQMFTNIGLAAKSFGQAAKMQAISSMIKSIALLIAAIVASIAVLGKLKPKEIQQGGAAMGIIAGAIVGMAYALYKMSDKLSALKLPNIGQILALILGIALAIKLVVNALNKISKIDPDRLLGSTTALIAIMGGLGLLIVAIAKISNKVVDPGSLSKISKMILTISASMWIMATALKKMNKVEWSSIGKMTIAILELVGLLTAIGFINKFSGNGLEKSAGIISALGGCLLLLVITMKLAGGLKSQHFTNALRVISVFSIMILELMGISRLFKNTEMMKVSGSILLVGVTIGILALVTKLVGGIEPDELAKGLILIGSLSGLVMGLIAVSKTVTKNRKNLLGLGTTLLGVALVIGVMAAAVFVFSKIDPAGLAKGVIAIGFLSLFTMGLLAVTKNFKPGNNAMKTLITLTVLIGILAAIAVALSFIRVSKLAPAVIALDSMLISLAGLVYTVSKLKANKAIVKNMAIITLTVGALAGIVFLLTNFTDTSKAMQASLALSALVISVGGLLAIISKLKVDIKSSWKGLVALTAMAAPLIAFVGVLKVMDMADIHNVMEKVIALSILTTVLTGLVIALGAVGVLTGGTFLAGAVGGILALTAMALPLLTFIGVLKLMDMADMKNSMKNVLALTKLIEKLTDCLFKISLVAPLALVADVAIYGMIGAISAIALLATAIGGITKAIPDLQTFLDVGLTVLAKIAEGIGTIFGSVIKGFIGKISEVLPLLGTQLSAFATNAEPFFDMMTKINGEKILDGVGKLSLAILALSGAQIISGISKFLGFGTTFGSMGKQLKEFGDNIMPFLESMTKIPSNATEGIRRLAESVGILTSSNFIDSLTKKLFGQDKNISRFGSDFKSLGEGIKGFSDALGDSLNLDRVKTGAEAVKILSEASKELPTDGGIGKIFSGWENISSYKDKFPDLAEGIKGFADKLNEGGNFDSSKVKDGAMAVKDLSEAAKNLPTEGGIGKLFSGWTDISDFKTKFPDLAEGIKGFADKLSEGKEFDGEKAKAGAEAVKSVAEAIKNIGPTDFKGFGVDATLDLTNLKNNLPLLGEGMANLVSKIKDLDQNHIQNATNMLWSIADLAKGGGFADNGKKLEEFGACFQSFINKMTEAFTTLSGLGKDTINSEVDKIRSFGNIAKDIVAIDKSKLEQFGESFKNLGSTGVEGFKNSIASDEAKNKGKEAVTSFIDSVRNAIDDNQIDSVKDKFDELGDEAYNGLNENDGDWRYNSFYNLGKNFVEGFAKGIIDNKELVTDPATEIGKYALEKAKKAIDSNSPSKETMKIGNYFTEGFAIGIGQYASEVGEAASNMGKYASEGLQNAISKVYDVMNLDGDMQPTIRPVLDLSDVESGVGTLSSMLDIDKDMSLNASLNSISTSINRRLQNRGNDDVISAIKDLSNSISGNTGNVYNVNGVSYSDSDTEVTNAIRTLVNAAVVERRT